MKKLKTVFWGTPEFALNSLESTFQNTELLGVVTQPDRPSGRGQKTLPCQVKIRAQEFSLPSFSPASLRKPSADLDLLWEWLSSHEQIDLFVVVAYGNILPQVVLDFPKLGCINVHGSLLPAWRGAAPIQRSLENNDAITGVCIQKMLFELDAGPVLLSKEYSLSGNENAVELSSSLSAIGALCLKEVFPKIAEANSLDWGVEQDKSQISFAQKITKEEGFWNSSWTAEKTHNRVRAFYAWPSVKFTLMVASGASKPVKILKTARVSPNIEALKTEFRQKNDVGVGGFCLTQKRCFLKCAESAEVTNSWIELLVIQPESSKALNAYDYIQNIYSQTPTAKR